MPAPYLDVKSPLLAAVIANAAVADKLGRWNGGPSIHTRRPVPANATYPVIVINVVSRNDNDGVNDYRPSVQVDLAVYGTQPAQTRAVEEIAERLYGQFHGDRFSLTVDNYQVSDVNVSGPYDAPDDDPGYAGRVVSLQVDLCADEVSSSVSPPDDEPDGEVLLVLTPQIIEEMVGNENKRPGDIIDGTGFDSVVYVITTGDVGPGTIACLLEEGDEPDLSDAAPVAASNVVGDVAIESGKNKRASFRYIGGKPYTRLTLEPPLVDPGTQWYVSAVAVLGHPYE